MIFKSARKTKFSTKGKPQVRIYSSGKSFTTIGILEHPTGFSICSIVKSFHS